MARYTKPYVLIKQKAKSGKTIYYYRLRGEKTMHSTGCTRAADAHAYAEERAAEDRKHRHGRTLRDLLGPYWTGACPHVTRIREEGKTVGAQHIKNRRRLLTEYVFNDAIASRQVAGLTRADVLDFRSRLLKKHPGMRPTVNNVMACLKTCVREVLYRQEIEHDPTAGVGQLTTERRETGVLTVEELQELFTGPGPWKDRQDRTCFLLAATTGMRRGEILALQWGDIGDKAVTVQRAWKMGELGPPKSGKARAVPLPARAVAALTDLQESSIRVGDGDLVFCYDDGGRIGNTWWTKRFAAAMKEAKIDARGRNITPHALRHTISTLLDREGQDPELIRDTFGWTTEQMRRRYLHRGAERYREQAEIIDRLLGE